jgi:hypothetical protein
MVQKRKTQNPLVKCDEKIFGTVASKKFWSSMSFQNLDRLSQIKKFPCLIMTMSTKCQKMSYNMMIGYDIYDRFTMEHFPLRQSMILTTSFFCSRLRS